MRKIIYNKDEELDNKPGWFEKSKRPTIKSELRRELGWVVEGAEKKTGAVLKKYPYPIFYIMCGIIGISIILRFTVLNGKSETTENKAVVEPAYQELKKSTIDKMPSNSMEKLEVMIELRTKVDALMQRGNLTKADSLFIISSEETINKLKDEN